MNIHPLEQTKQPLPERAAQQIVSLIVDGTFAPGDKLPGELQLAQRLGVGRSTVREAIKSLVSRNVLEIHRGNGTFVCEQTGRVDDPLGLQFVQDKRKLGLDLCEIRAIIEPQIAALAAENATPEEIDAMQEICDQIAQKVEQGANYGDLDSHFHTMLAQCTRNSIMPSLIPIITQAIPLFIDITGSSLAQQTVITHQMVLDAVRAHDAEAAAAAMRRHLQDNRDSILAVPEK